jgi:hypothetical protein
LSLVACSTCMHCRYLFGSLKRWQAAVGNYILCTGLSPGGKGVVIDLFCLLAEADNWQAPAGCLSLLTCLAHRVRVSICMPPLAVCKLVDNCQPIRRLSWDLPAAVLRQQRTCWQLLAVTCLCSGITVQYPSGVKAAGDCSRHFAVLPASCFRQEALWFWARQRGSVAAESQSVGFSSHALSTRC